MKDVEIRFRENETRQALRALFSVLDCIWVNKEESIERVTSNKLFQQCMAERSGLLTPQTVMGNCHEHLASFSASREGVLIKTMGCIRLDDLDSLAVYSERFSHEEIKNSREAVRMCPVYAQEYIEKKYEYRVMVIDKEVLSCRIDSQSSDMTKTDWRHYDFDNVEHVQVDLPHSVKNNLVRFMETIDLRYGAIDLIETPNKDFVFLEVNPSGQWGWIHDLAGLPIPESVARMLTTL